MKKPELGPPPIFDEEMNCSHQCGFCKIPFSRLSAHYSHKLTREISTLKAGGVGLLDQLQAETQRADKAEEMVASFREIFNMYFTQKPPRLGSNFYGFMCDLEGKAKASCSESEPISNAFRQKLCDEIVGKIDARQEAIHIEKPWLDSDGYLDSIDIVKSVLSEGD